jgi:hypothetical protein
VLGNAGTVGRRMKSVLFLFFLFATGLPPALTFSTFPAWPVVRVARVLHATMQNCLFPHASVASASAAWARWPRAWWPLPTTILIVHVDFLSSFTIFSVGSDAYFLNNLNV